MIYNTAIFFDIENLIGGYGKAVYLEDLSLTEIHGAIVKKEISGIAIQRAYANWADNRLNVLREDIVELGIEPIQMFGFGKGSHKNASDIHLAIDAMEVALTKPAVDQFVIVSGDGGFSSLAKKLHEYSKRIIGCAYRRAANRVFEAVCDEFIWLDEPESSEADTTSVGTPVTSAQNPVLAAFKQKYRPIEPQSADSVINRGQEVLSFLAKNNSSKNALKSTGLNISVYSELLKHRIVGFSPIKYGFPKFVDFVRHTIHGSTLKLVLKEPSDYRLILHEHSLRDFVIVQSIPDAVELHTPDNYVMLLSRQEPRFPVPELDIVLELSNLLVEHGEVFQDISYGDLIDRLCEEFHFDARASRATITSLISAGCFTRTPETASLSEQRLLFACSSVQEALQRLHVGMRQKIEGLLGEVDAKCLEQVLPNWQSFEEQVQS